MQVRVLGCSGAIAKGCRTTSFLVDGEILVDAGTGVGELSLQEMAGIDHVLLTHSHLDHIAALPLMVDAVAKLRAQPLQVHALPATLDALRRHIFNDVIWPDFTRLPTPEHPFIEFTSFEIGQQFTLNAKLVEVLPASHSVPAVGLSVNAGSGAWVFSGDTGVNPPFWQRIRQLPVKALVVETAFGSGEQALAVLSGHLSPNTLIDQLALLPTQPDYPIYITHTKPSETAEITAQLNALEAKMPHPVGWPLKLHHLTADDVFII
jgi:cAMP phosphodiesterase